MDSSPLLAPTPHCLNCATELEGAYCHICGQRADTERLTIKRLWGQVFEAFTDLDRGFLHTLKVLTVAPGLAIKDYLDGKRSPMYNPFRFYILTAAALIIVTQLTGFDIIAQSQSVNNEAMGLQTSARQATFQKDLARMMSENMQTLQLVFLPIIAWSTWIAFGRGSRRNYAEVLIYQCYTSGYSTILTAAAIPIFRYVDGADVYYLQVSFGLFVLLSALFAYGLFGRHWLSLILKSIVAFALYMIAIMILMIPPVVIYFILHPELLR